MIFHYGLTDKFVTLHRSTRCVITESFQKTFFCVKRLYLAKGRLHLAIGTRRMLI